MTFRLLALVLLAALSTLRAAPVFETVAAFERKPAIPSARLLWVQAAGAYFGTTTAGGAYDSGTVFKLLPDGTVTSLVCFSGETGATKGDAPDAGLVLGNDGALYGVTIAGGTAGYGTVFRVTTTGTFKTLHEFTGSSGTVPNSLMLASDGFFYGTTMAGGTYDLGTVFKMTVTNVPANPVATITTLANFGGTSGTRKGSAPVGPLVHIGGLLFGATQGGGTDDFGTVFKVSTAGSTTAFFTMAEFTGTTGVKPGAYPAAGLVLHADGGLYGTTEFGGAGDFGTVFRIFPEPTLPSPAPPVFTFTLLHEFDEIEGAQPAGTLVMGSDPAQSLFGTAVAGGEEDEGIVFKIAPVTALIPGEFDLLASFTGDGPDVPGESPRAGLISTPLAGEFAGTTTAGGPGGTGTVFKINETGVFTPLATFASPTGWEPSGGVATSPDGNLLVPMYEGGAFGKGTLLSLSPSGAGMSLGVDFNDDAGERPKGALARIGTLFYGVTEDGGASGRGTYFRYEPSGGFETLASAADSSGSMPEGPLTPTADGSLYGVAREGGAAGKGAVVRITPGGTRTNIVSFTGISGATRGTRPRGPLALGADGNFYGVTEAGGSNDLGTIFMLTPPQASQPDAVLVTLHDFTASPAPNRPHGGLVAGPDGNFHGTTSTGGTTGNGTVFRVTPGGGVTPLAQFTGSSGAAPGSQPEGALLAAPDGTLYGTTTQSGSGGEGGIFRIRPDGSFTQLFSFTGTSGAAPGGGAHGELAFHSDGQLYGTTGKGGLGGGGTVFRLRQLGPHAETRPIGYSGMSVLLVGGVVTGGEPVSASFEFGPTPALGQIIATTALGADSPAAFSAPLASLTPGTTYYYRAKAVNPSGTSLGLTRSFIAPHPIELWKAQLLGDPEAPDLGDPDDDGLATLAEYGVLANPATSDPAELPHATIRPYGDGARLSMIVRRDPARSDITLEVLAAPAATGPWIVLATSTPGAPFTGPGYYGGDANTPGIKQVEIRDVLPASAAQQRFMKLRVTR